MSQSSTNSIPNPALTTSNTHTIQNQQFIVTPVFKQGEGETLGEVLLRLMKCDFSKL